MNSEDAKVMMRGFEAQERMLMWALRTMPWRDRCRDSAEVRAMLRALVP